MRNAMDVPACDIESCQHHKIMVRQGADYLDYRNLDSPDAFSVVHVQRHRFAVDGKVYSVCSRHLSASDEQIVEMLRARPSAI
jgi:hypothetical protein